MGDSIAEDSYLVVALAGGRFEQTYGFPPFREYTLSGINDNGERLALLDDLFAVVDEVDFDDGPPWPVTPDGLGPSLELIDPDQDNDDPRNWHASIAPAGHTAGAQNSVFATALPPWIEDVQSTADPQPDLDPIVITATVLGATSVELAYVIGADRPPTEITRTMYDDGTANDGRGGRRGVGAAHRGRHPGPAGGNAGALADHRDRGNGDDGATRETTTPCSTTGRRCSIPR